MSGLVARAKNAAIVVAALVAAALLVVGLVVLGAQVLARCLDVKSGAMTAISAAAVGLAVAVTTGIIRGGTSAAGCSRNPCGPEKTEFCNTPIIDLMNMCTRGDPGVSADLAAIQQMFVRGPAPVTPPHRHA